MLRLLPLGLLATLALPAVAQPTWQSVSERTDLRTLLVLNDGTLLAGTSIDGFRSVDGGVSFDTLRFVRHAGTGDQTSDGVTPTRDGINQFAAVVFDGQTQTTVFAAGEDGGYRSEDGGATWTAGPPGLTPDGCALNQRADGRAVLEYYAVAASPNGSVLFTGTDDDFSPDCKSRGFSWESDDAGATWPMGGAKEYYTILGLPDEYSWHFGSTIATRPFGNGTSTSVVDISPVSSVSFAENVDGTLYAASSGFLRSDGTRTDASGIWRLSEIGGTWERVNAGLPTLDVPAIVALDNGRLIAGTFDAGLFVSTDRGDSWTPASDGLTGDALSVQALAVGPDAVWASTRGGLFRSAAFAVADETGPEPGALSVAAWPNPAQSTATVEVTRPAAGAVRVEAFDALGRRVAVLHDGSAAGPLRMSVRVSEWPAGVYVVRAISAEGAASARVVVGR